MTKSFFEQTKEEIQYAVDHGVKFETKQFDDGVHFISSAGYWVTTEEEAKELYLIINNEIENTKSSKTIIEAMKEIAGEEIQIKNKRVLSLVNELVTETEIHGSCTYFKTSSTKTVDGVFLGNLLIRLEQLKSGKWRAVAS